MLHALEMSILFVSVAVQKKLNRPTLRIEVWPDETCGKKAKEAKE